MIQFCLSHTILFISMIALNDRQMTIPTKIPILTSNCVFEVSAPKTKPKLYAFAGCRSYKPNSCMVENVAYKHTSVT